MSHMCHLASAIAVHFPDAFQRPWFHFSASIFCHCDLVRVFFASRLIAICKSGLLFSLGSVLGFSPRSSAVASLPDKPCTAVRASRQSQPSASNRVIPEADRNRILPEVPMLVIQESLWGPRVTEIVVGWVETSLCAPRGTEGSPPLLFSVSLFCRGELVRVEVRGGLGGETIMQAPI